MRSVTGPPLPRASAPPPWLLAAGLPQAWRGQAAWRLLDTHFGTGERLVQAWQAWTQDPDACRMLHVVAFAECAVPWAQLQRTLTNHLGPASGLAQELEPQWSGLMPGFHRLVLQAGRLQLSLCIGPMLSLLREQQFNADTVVIAPFSGAGSSPWDNWSLKALARLCRRGSTLAVLPGSGLDPARAAAAGWTASDPARAGIAASGPQGYPYQPPWQIKTTRARWAQAPRPVSRCIVVGAGLAGAGVAGALSLRGWQVTVLDAALEPAAGASGLPVGLFAPQLSRDDGPRSRLSRAGIRATLQAARRLLRQGQDWDPCGVARIDATLADLPLDWPEQGLAWACAAVPEAHDRDVLAHLARPDQALWHATAGWIKPQQLVRAWLAQPGVGFQGNSAVQRIRIEGGQWQLFGSSGQLLAEAPQLVLAGAGGSPALLRMALAAARQTVPTTPLPLTPVDGQISWALHRAHDGGLFPHMPVNGGGSVVAHVPWAGGPAWFVGASYEPAGDWAAAVSQAHAHNLARLAQLLPGAAAGLGPAFAADAVQAWRGTRWTNADRLPLAGAWPLAGMPSSGPGLWLSTAMGSRGLTYAALCGELIAAQLGAEPLPLDTGLQRCIDVRRIVAAHTRTPATS